MKNAQDNKRRRVKKPWCSEQLTGLWNKYCDAEARWKRAAPTDKSQKKTEMRLTRGVFDKAVQSAKRTFWLKQRDDLLQMMKGDSRTFWQRVKQLGPYSHSSQSNTVPWQVEDNDGNVISDRAAVLNRWQCDFSSLLKHVQVDHLTLAADINNEHAIETGMQNPIRSCEIYSVLLHAKNGKAVGVDGIPIEALRNQTAVEFMLSLFNECYSKGAIPSAWTKSIINSIPKNSGAQSKDHLHYRGIALTSAIYKIFCG